MSEIVPAVGVPRLALTVAEAAEAAGTSVATITEAIAAGTLKVVEIPAGGRTRRRVTIAALNEWLSTLTRTPADFPLPRYTEVPA